MSTKEARRVPLLEKYISREIDREQAAASLQLSERQVSRLAKKYQTEGMTGLTHRSRGQPSPHKISSQAIDQALSLIRSDYPDFGPTFAHEKLVARNAWSYSVESLRLAMIEAGIHRRKRRRILQVHQSRKRREQLGELVQADGSPHDWFEGRGPYCTLIVIVDDATGGLMHLWFALQESKEAYFSAFRPYLLNHGVPLALYVDRHAVFRVNSSRDQSAGSMDSHKRTQFGRAMDELGIELIFAYSPQAKGLVETINGTLQDRLVKEMRLLGISDIETANQYLPIFMEDYNRRFARPASSPVDAHRPLTLADNLDEILIEKETRILTRNLEFQFDNIRYQIQTERPTYALVHATVDIHIHKDELKVFYKQKELAYKTIKIYKPQKPISKKHLNSLPILATG